MYNQKESGSEQHGTEGLTYGTAKVGARSGRPTGQT